MAKLPRTPDLDCLRERDLPLRTIEAGTTWHRIYRRGGAHPTRWDALRYYGPTTARFDHHLLDDGLYYPSSMTNRIILALYERSLARKALPDSPTLHRALADPLIEDPLHEACVEIGYAFM